MKKPRRVRVRCIRAALSTGRLVMGQEYLAIWPKDNPELWIDGTPWNAMRFERIYPDFKFSQKRKDQQVRAWKIRQLRGMYGFGNRNMMPPSDSIAFDIIVDRMIVSLGAESEQLRRELLRRPR